MTIADLEFREDVALTRRSRLWRATRTEHADTVIVKSVSRQDDVAASRCRNHYQLTQSLAIPGVARGLELIEEPEGIHLVMEDAGNTSLLSYLTDYEYDLDTLLELAEQIADALDALHSQRILHRDLSLANIVVKPDESRATIVDLGLAIKLEHSVESLSLNVMEGTLAYISPEQTGRLRKPIDHRSDLYSFGAVLYHVITGTPPFRGNDALEVMHAHVTRIAPSPQRIRSSIPIPLDHLVMRLLEKEPEARYQSAFGIAEDLRRIRRWLKSADDHRGLDLQHVSTSVTYHYPRSVIGRDAEITQLRQLVQTALTSRQQLVLLSGLAGSGKSMIIRGFLERMPRNGVITTSGKYEQYTSGQPLTGLGHAMENMIRGILRRSAEDVDHWRKVISPAVGEDAGLLATIISNLPLIADMSAATPAKGAAESRIRLIGAFSRLIETVAHAAGGFVLVLDDLHWADEASLDVIHQVVSAAAHVPVAVIGTYRSEASLKPDHPVLTWPHDSELQNKVTATAVLPLSTGSIEQIVKESLGLQSEHAAPLASVLMERTGGHPLFVNQYLAFLVERGILSFDRQLHRWKWSEEQLRTVPVQHSVSDVIHARFNQLPQATQQLLSKAAAIGTEFNLALLARIRDASVEQVVQQLQPAVTAGLVSIVEQHAVWFGSFVHDRVQETALATTPQTELKAVHAAIVRVTLSPDGSLRDAVTVFELADHMTQAAEQVCTPEFISTNIGAMFEAAQKARQAGALREALAYALRTRELIGPDGWRTNPEVFHQATVIAGAAAGGLGDHATSHALFDECLVNLSPGVDAAYVASLKAQVYTREGRFDDLMVIGYRGLSMLGIEMQNKPSMMSIAGQMIQALLSLKPRLLQDRRAEPFNHDERLQIADNLLFQLTSAGYNFSQQMMGHITLKRGALAAELGHADVSIDSYCQIGMVFLAAGMLDKAVALGDLSISLIERSSDNAARARASFITGGHIYFWAKPLATAISTFESGLEYAIRSGSQFMLYWGEGSSSELRAFAGMPVAEQHARILAGLENLHRVYQRTDNIPWTSHYFQAAVERVLAIYNPAIQPPPELRNVIEREGWLLDEMQKAKDATGICSWSIGTLKVAIATQDLPLARAGLERFTAYKHGAITSWMQCEVELYTALMVGLAARTSTPTKADKDLLKVAVTRMKAFAKRNPNTFLSRALLVEGLQEYVSGNMERAFHQFQGAVQQAHVQQNLFLEAVALEWSAYAAENSIMSEIVGAIRHRAARTYRLYGAVYLAEKLEAQRSAEAIQSAATQRVTVSTTVHASTSATVSVNRYALDIDSIFKASSAIAGEIVHETLVKRLLAIVLENAGADEGALLIDNRDQLTVEATLVTQGDVFTLLSEPFEHSSVVCKPAVHLVNRTGEPLVVDEANVDPDYATDAFVTSRNVRSIMVMPILHKGVRIGLLHLVNSHMTRAFTPERLEVVQLLTSQIAVSLENARLYNEQRATLEAAARFVPSEFLDALGGKSIREVELGEGIRLPITVLFVDIRQFTTISERMTAEATMAFLNDYLKVVEPVIRSNHGFVDKYVGDAVMALFPEHPVDAVRAALAMLDALDEFNALRASSHNQAVRVGVGIHTGEVMLGTVGTGDRMDTTVIGDTVNIAARLEELTKHNSASILISEDVYSLLPSGEFSITERGSEIIRGRQAPIRLYEVSHLQRQ